MRVTFAMVAPKVIFRFNFFVALCASNIVLSKVCFNIFCCSKACEYSFLQYKRKRINVFVKFIKTRYVIGVMLLKKKKNLEYLIIWLPFQGCFRLIFLLFFMIFFSSSISSLNCRGIHSIRVFFTFLSWLKIKI